MFHQSRPALVEYIDSRILTVSDQFSNRMKPIRPAKAMGIITHLPILSIAVGIGGLNVFSLMSGGVPLRLDVYGRERILTKTMNVTATTRIIKRTDENDETEKKLENMRNNINKKKIRADNGGLRLSSMIYHTE